MKIAIVNDALSQLGERTFWVMLKEWLNADFIGGSFETLAECASSTDHDIVIRNGSYFGPIRTNAKQIALVQDLFSAGPLMEMQKSVIRGCCVTIFNTQFTANACGAQSPRIIPLPVDFSLFTLGNRLGYQAATSLPPGCIMWVGAAVGAAGAVKGWPLMQAIARRNPDLNFVCVFKDAIPDPTPPNMRCFAQLPQEDVAALARACQVGLCTSVSETQHLAGIEMGACGLPILATSVGVYFKREYPGATVDPNPADFGTAIRQALSTNFPPAVIRAFWQAEFDIPVIRSQWERLIDEIKEK